MRAITAISIVTPLTYMTAQSLWMLIPSAVARGMGMAGFELGRINAGIQLADPDRVTEYAAIQSTVVGLRGLLTPVVMMGLLRLGVPAQRHLPDQRVCPGTGMGVVWLGEGATAGGRGLGRTSEAAPPLAVPATDCALVMGNWQGTGDRGQGSGDRG